MSESPRSQESEVNNLIAATSEWEAWSPSEFLRPRFGLQGPQGEPGLLLAGDGKGHCFGWWTRRIPVRGGATYHIEARLRWQGFEDPNQHVLTAVVWRRGEQPRDWCAHTYLSVIDRHSDSVVSHETFRVPADTTDAEFLLVLRYAPTGVVWWESLSVQEVPPKAARLAHVAVTMGGPLAPATPESALAFWDGLLQKAPTDVDLVCLPECMNAAGQGRPPADIADPYEGPTYRLLSAHARRLRTNISGCFYEREHDTIFNTAVLCDRNGACVGRYRKVHLYWPEAVDGVTPGDELPVFETDLGVLGILTCYDSWFPETTRILALRGAELVLFPNYNYESRLMSARAIENGVYVAIPSVAGAAAIIDTLGDVVAETRETGITAARIDLAYRPSVHQNAGEGSRLNASPGGRRALRNATSDRLFDDLMQEHRRW
jgi:predicted amidohydrolase